MRTVTWTQHAITCVCVVAVIRSVPKEIVTVAPRRFGTISTRAAWYMLIGEEYFRTRRASQQSQSLRLLRPPTNTKSLGNEHKNVPLASTQHLGEVKPERGSLARREQKKRRRAELSRSLTQIENEFRTWVKSSEQNIGDKSYSCLNLGKHAHIYAITAKCLNVHKLFAPWSLNCMLLYIETLYEFLSIHLRTAVLRIIQNDSRVYLFIVLLKFECE